MYVKYNLCFINFSAFTYLSLLTTHKQSHTGEHLFECELCEKSFKTSSEWTTHKQIHIGEKPFNCGSCQKVFVQLTHLTAHKRSHTGKKYFSVTYVKRHLLHFLI